VLTVIHVPLYQAFRLLLANREAEVQTYSHDKQPRKSGEDTRSSIHITITTQR
jgi:hypothetical protein